MTKINLATSFSQSLIHEIQAEKNVINLDKVNTTHLKHSLTKISFVEKVNPTHIEGTHTNKNVSILIKNMTANIGVAPHG